MVIAHEVVPTILPKVAGGRALQRLIAGVDVADLGCGGGGLMLQLAERFPASRFVGFEISEPALARCRRRIADSGLSNVSIRDGRTEPLDAIAASFDLVLTFDVLHDATDPLGLARMVQRSLRPGGVWLMADINACDGVRQNLAQGGKAAIYYAFSICLCMSSALSDASAGGGAGLGTLGLSIPVAKQLLNAAGFGGVGVLAELTSSRWFEAAVDVNDLYGAPSDLCLPCEA